MNRVLTKTGALRAGWSLFMVLIAAVLIGVLGIWYTNQVQRTADRRWCELMTTIARPESSVSKQLPKQEHDRQVRVVRALSKLTADLGCAK